MGLSDLVWNGRRPDSINVDAFPYELEAPRSVGLEPLGVGLLGAAFCAWVVGKQLAATGSIDPAEVIFFALLTAASLVGVITGSWRLLRPDLLRLSGEGLEFRTLWRQGHWRWSQVRNFRIERGRHPKIAFDIDGVSAPDWLAPTRLSTQWPVSADRLVKILNHAKLSLDPSDASRQSVVALTT
jgi:hypothetical protein